MLSLNKNTIAAVCVVVLACAGSGRGNKFVNSQDSQRYIAGHRVLRYHQGAGPGMKERPFVNYASVIFQDRAGVFWLGGLRAYTFDENRNQWLDLEEEREQKAFGLSVRRICQDKAGRIWLKALRSGIKVFDGKSWRSANEFAPPVAIPEDNSVMFTGIDGRLWFVTHSGLITFDGWKWTSVRIPDDTERAYGEMLSSFTDTQEAGSATLRKRRSDKAASPERDQGSGTQVKNGDALLPEILNGFQGRDGRVWLAARKAIVRFDQTQDSWTVFSPRGLREARVIYEDHRGRLWFADQRGHVSVCSNKDDQWTSYDLATYFPQTEPRVITGIYVDKVGQVMIGTSDAGLIVFDERYSRWRIVNDLDSDVPIDGVFAIYEDRTGRIWVATGLGVVVLGR